jgi:hypothetical protein
VWGEFFATKGGDGQSHEDGGGGAHGHGVMRGAAIPSSGAPHLYPQRDWAPVRPPLHLAASTPIALPPAPTLHLQTHRPSPPPPQYDQGELIQANPYPPQWIGRVSAAPCPLPIRKYTPEEKGEGRLITDSLKDVKENGVVALEEEEERAGGEGPAA